MEEPSYWVRRIFVKFEEGFDERVLGGKRVKKEVLVQMCNFVGVHPPLCLSG